MKTLIIGDIHGCYEELQLLLKKASYEKGDRLIFLGDLINKGPFSVETLNFVRKGKHECILGNHELGFLKALEDEQWRRPRFYELLEQLGQEREEIITWLKALPLYIEEENFICIHGGLEPGLDLHQQRAEVATRIRTWGGNSLDMDNENDPPWFDFYQGKKMVFFGHWAMKGYVKRANCIGLDTGCVWGGKLSAYHVEEDNLIQVNALKQYKVP